MESKSKSAKERRIMLFDKIDTKTAESAIKRIAEINIEDAEFADYCRGGCRSNAVAVLKRGILRRIKIKQKRI